MRGQPLLEPVVFGFDHAFAPNCTEDDIYDAVRK
jgi:hypothetical protein